MVDFKVLNTNRIYGLDILRAFAILFVVYGHGYPILKSCIQEKYYNLLEFDGVSMFFVLSGFLIGQILIKLFQKENINIKDVLNFWIRRWFRTLPNYFFVLTFLSLTFFFLKRIKLLKAIKFYFFAQNLYYNQPGFFIEAWSISVEEWFYLSVPVLILIFSKCFSLKITKSILFAAFFVIFFVTSYRFFHSFTHPAIIFSDWNITYRMQVITRLDSLMYGLLGAFVYIYNKKIFFKYKKEFFILGIFILLISKYIVGFTSYVFYNNVFSFIIESFGALFLIPFLVSIKKGQGFFYKMFTFISIISYSMYLINYTLVQDLLLPGSFKIFGIIDSDDIFFLILKYFLYWFYTLIGSYFLFIFIEKPTTRLRENFKFH